MRHPCLFPRPPGGAGNFLLRGQEKVTKEKATPVLRFSSIHGRKVRSGRPGLPTRLPWRAGKWAQSIAPTLPGLIVRPSPQHRGPRSASMTAIMASFEARSNNLLRPLTRTGGASKGAPRTRRADDGSVRRMARRMRASSPQAQGCAFGEPRRPFAHPEHMDVLRTCSRGGLSLGDFSLAKQREVTRAPGRGAEQDRDVVHCGRAASSARPNAPPDSVSGRTSSRVRAKTRSCRAGRS